jgi:hypothetical protein
MVLSGLCVVHCLALPVLAALLPLGMLVTEDDLRLHGIMFAVAVPLSVLGLRQGWLHHGRPWIPALGVAGLAFMGWDLLPLGAIHDHDWTLPGVLLVALAHGLNIRELRLALRS